MGEASPAAPSAAGAADGEGVLGEWVASQGLRRSYALHMPPGCGAGRRCPLIVAFHGAGGSHQFAENVGLVSAAERAGFAVAAPDGVDNNWAIGCGGCTTPDRSGIDDVRMTANLVTHLAARAPVDPARVSAVGWSNGASFVYRLACGYPLAGAGVVAGVLFDRSACGPARAVPLVAFHGRADEVIPYPQGAVSAQTWASLGGCETTPLETPLPDLAPDGTSVTRYDFPGCGPGAAVSFFAIAGGGHTWPGGPASGAAGQTQDIQASEEIVAFFSRHAAAP
jgi:polyhydroxybutyrate depolymerase